MLRRPLLLILMLLFATASANAERPASAGQDPVAPATSLDASDVVVVGPPMLPLWLAQLPQRGEAKRAETKPVVPSPDQAEPTPSGSQARRAFVQALQDHSSGAAPPRYCAFRNYRI